MAGIKAHRDGDSRTCGAKTTVQGQDNVYVNGKLWAVDQDPNNHGAGNLDAAHGRTVRVNGKGVIVHAPDDAEQDNLCQPLGGDHCSPKTDQGSDNVLAY